MRVKKRRPFISDQPNGMLESDNDWVENNFKTCLWLLKRELRRQMAEMAEVTRRMRQLVAALTTKIEELPDNPSIKRLSGPASCFAIQASDLGHNWTPVHHDFKAQYSAVVAVLKAVKPEQAMGRLRTIIKTSQIKHRGDKIVLHADVIAHLKTLLD